MTTIVAPNRVTSSSSTSLLSQSQQHHNNQNNNEVDDDVRKKGENNDDNNEYNQNNTTSNNSNNKNNNNFFDDWKKGNWCWERDYDKYPVVLFSNNNNNNNNYNCLHNNNNGTTIKVEEKKDEDQMNDDDSDNEYSINDRMRRDDIKNASDPGITGKGDNDNDDSDDVDDSFYDDWVEGNWCLLDNHKNKNNNNNIKNSNDTNDDTSRGTTGTQNNNKNNNNNESSKRKRKRSSDDDEKEDEDIYEEEEEYYDEENEDGNDDDDDDGEYLPDDNNIVRNHQEDERSAVKNSKRGTYNWTTMFRKLVAYKKLCKDTMVPHRYKKDPKLGWWAFYQRQAYKNNKLLPQRLALLNSIDFEWEGQTAVTYQALWMNMFEKLIEYKNQHTNTMVPKGYDKDPKLGHWVVVQRCYYKKDKLLPKRLALLNSIDFVWKGQTAVIYHELWMKMFRKLVAYKKLCKDTMVPYHYMEDPKLGQWACHQRQAYKKDQLLPQRLVLLNSIDFEWEGAISAKNQRNWMIMFRKLVAYKNLCKDTMVPYRYKDNPKLGKWVSTQRETYNKNKLLPQRLDLLNSIDFIWNGREAAR